MMFQFIIKFEVTCVTIEFLRNPNNVCLLKVVHNRYPISIKLKKKKKRTNFQDIKQLKQI